MNFLSEHTRSLTPNTDEWISAVHDDVWEEAWTATCELVGPNSYEFEEVFGNKIEELLDQVIH